MVWWKWKGSDSQGSDPFFAALVESHRLSRQRLMPRPRRPLPGVRGGIHQNLAAIPRRTRFTGQRPDCRRKARNRLTALTQRRLF